MAVIDTARIWLGALAAVPLLVAATCAVAAVTQLGQARHIATAATRAAVQLAAVGLIVTAALNSLAWSLGGVCLMVAVGAGTSARRLGRFPRAFLIAAASIAAPAGLVLGCLLLSSALPATGMAVLPVGGILVGGAMTATTLAGRRLLADLRQRHGEIEAALALGMQPREAIRELLGRSAAAESLVPALDQTRTVGLVTLPGAFVGMVLGGASPSQAALVQLLVLVALLAAETGAALLATELLAAASSRGTAALSAPQM